MFKHLPNYHMADPSLWQGRKDTPEKSRFYEQICFIDDEKNLIDADKKTVFLGFGSDQGIIRNQGRPGAKLGPDAIKTQLAKLPCFTTEKFIDLGSIVCEDLELESAQSQFAQLISFCHQQGHFTVGLGGGHEMAWGHYQGLSPHYNNLGIINFDAHFDLRPYEPDQLGTSGTPFSQIAADCQMANRSFNYCCLGIQKRGNTNTLFERAHALNVKYLTADYIHSQHLAAQYDFIDAFINRVDHVYLSFCLDVLAESVAPGVSAPQPLGLNPWHILPLLKHIMQSGKVVSMDMAELSPPLDHDKKTARLAALIIAELLDIN